jgi:hypothetical protein
MGATGFEPVKAEPSDLQSDPFGHFGTRPSLVAGYRRQPSWFRRIGSKAGSESIVPSPTFFNRPRRKNLSAGADSTTKRNDPHKPQGQGRSCDLPAGCDETGPGRASLGVEFSSVDPDRRGHRVRRHRRGRHFLGRTVEQPGHRRGAAGGRFRRSSFDRRSESLRVWPWFLVPTD